MEAQNLERLALGLTFSAIFAYGVSRFISIIMANLRFRFAVISLLVCVMRGFVANRTNYLCIITCNRHKSGISKYRYRANGQRMRENIAVFDFKLDSDDMEMLTAMDTNKSSFGWDS